MSRLFKQHDDARLGPQRQASGPGRAGRDARGRLGSLLPSAGSLTLCRGGGLSDFLRHCRSPSHCRPSLVASPATTAGERVPEAEMTAVVTASRI